MRGKEKSSLDKDFGIWTVFPYTGQGQTNIFWRVTNSCKELGFDTRNKDCRAVKIITILTTRQGNFNVEKIISLNISFHNCSSKPQAPDTFNNKLLDTSQNSVLSVVNSDEEL